MKNTIKSYCSIYTNEYIIITTLTTIIMLTIFLIKINVFLTAYREVKFLKSEYSATYVMLAFILTLIFVFSGTASAKSLYVIADHHTGQFDAYNINPNGTITYQATYNVNFNDPAGIAIHNRDNVIFITSEFNAGVEIVDASTYTYIGTASGPSNLAGIDVDEKNDIVYTVRRNTNRIYAYDWNPVTKTLTLKSGYPKALPNCSAAYGIAYDD